MNGILNNKFALMKAETFSLVERLIECMNLIEELIMSKGLDFYKNENEVKYTISAEVFDDGIDM